MTQAALPDVVALRIFQIKIIYWGPGEAGKTTNYHRLKELFENCLISRGFSIATSADRTLWNDSVWYQFPFAKLRLKVMVNVTTTTGQERFLTTREYILQNADGVVFVGDSHPDKHLENQQSFQELQTFTHKNPVPILVLLNKRDVPDAIPVEDFRELLDLPEDTSTEKIIYQSIANDLSNLGDVKAVFIEMIQQILKRRLGGG